MLVLIGLLYGVLSCVEYSGALAIPLFTNAKINVGGGDTRSGFIAEPRGSFQGDSWSSNYRPGFYVIGTTNQEVYQSQKVSALPILGFLSWNIPVVPGNYTVTLLVAELSPNVNINDRAMNVTINDVNYGTIDAKVGSRFSFLFARSYTFFNVEVTDFNLRILLQSAEGSTLGPMLNGFMFEQDSSPINVAPLPSWSVLDTELPSPRFEFCGVEFMDRIVILGGRSSSRFTSVEVYNPSNNSWRTLPGPSFPSPDHLQCAVDGSRIVVGGGYSGGRFPLSKPMQYVYAYSPRKNLFESITEFPPSRIRGNTGVAVHRGKWYFVNGNTAGHGQGLSTISNFFDCYDPVADQWSTLPNSPTPRDHAGALVVGDTLFVCGGQRGGSVKYWTDFLNTIDYYDFQRGIWMQLDELLSAAHPGSHPAMLPNGYITIAGGEYNNISYAATHFVDPLNGVIPTTTSLNFDRHGCPLVSCGEEIYILGGASSRPSLKGKDNSLVTAVEVLSSNRNLLCGANPSFDSYWDF